MLSTLKQPIFIFLFVIQHVGSWLQFSTLKAIQCSQRSFPGAFSSCSFNKAHMSHQSGCLSSPRRNKHLVPIVQGHKQHCFNPDDLHSHIPPLKQNKDEHPNRWEAYSAIFNSCQLFYLEAIKIKYLKEAASALTTNHKNNNLIFNSSLLPSRQWQEPYSPPQPAPIF